MRAREGVTRGLSKDDTQDDKWGSNSGDIIKGGSHIDCVVSLTNTPWVREHPLKGFPVRVMSVALTRDHFVW